MADTTLCLIGTVMIWCFIAVVAARTAYTLYDIARLLYEVACDSGWGRALRNAGIGFSIVFGVMGYIFLALYLESYCR